MQSGSPASRVRKLSGRQPCGSEIGRAVRTPSPACTGMCWPSRKNKDWEPSTLRQQAIGRDEEKQENTHRNDAEILAWARGPGNCLAVDQCLGDGTLLVGSWVVAQGLHADPTPRTAALARRTFPCRAPAPEVGASPSAGPRAPSSAVEVRVPETSTSRSVAPHTDCRAIQRRACVRMAVRAETLEFVASFPTYIAKTTLGESQSPSFGVAPTNNTADEGEPMRQRLFPAASAVSSGCGTARLRCGANSLWPTLCLPVRRVREP